MRMPRSFRLGIHRIKIMRPRVIDETGIKTKRSKCEVSPPRKAKVVGFYDADRPRRNSTWRGSFSYRDKLVNVISGLDGTVGREVLAHEINHAIYDYGGLADVVPAKYEEAIVDTFARVGLAVLRENPALAEYLLGDDE